MFISLIYEYYGNDITMYSSYNYVCMYVCMCTMVTMQQYCVMTEHN